MRAPGVSPSFAPPLIVVGLAVGLGLATSAMAWWWTILVVWAVFAVAVFVWRLWSSRPPAVRPSPPDCPECQASLVWDDLGWYCRACGHGIDDTEEVAPGDPANPHRCEPPGLDIFGDGLKSWTCSCGKTSAKVHRYGDRGTVTLTASGGDYDIAAGIGWCLDRINVPVRVCGGPSRADLARALATPGALGATIGLLDFRDAESPAEDDVDDTEGADTGPCRRPGGLR